MLVEPVQLRIDELEEMLSMTVKHPAMFRDVNVVRATIEERIMQLECEQLAEIENSRPGRRLNSESKQNVIVPIIPAWQHCGKGMET